MIDDAVFNVPREPHPASQRYDFLEKLIFDLFQGRPFSLLEIGVDGGLFAEILHGSHRIEVAKLVGVDPYVGRDEQYHEVSKQFSSMGFDLIRQRSHEAWQQGLGGFDCIYVDALHDYLSTFEDMALWFFRLAPGGTMVVDDFGFVAWPEKTRAVNDFIRIARPLIDGLGWRSYHVFTGDAGEWPIPVEKSNVLIRAANSLNGDAIATVIDGLKEVLATGKRPQIVPDMESATLLSK